MTNIITELALTKGEVKYCYYLKNMNLYSLSQNATFAKAIQLADNKGFEVAMTNIDHQAHNHICDAEELLSRFSQLEQ